MPEDNNVVACKDYYDLYTDALAEYENSYSVLMEAGDTLMIASTTMGVACIARSPTCIAAIAVFVEALDDWQEALEEANDKYEALQMAKEEVENCFQVHYYSPLEDNYEEIEFEEPLVIIGDIELEIDETEDIVDENDS